MTLRRNWPIRAREVTDAEEAKILQGERTTLTRTLPRPPNRKASGNWNTRGAPKVAISVFVTTSLTGRLSPWTRKLPTC